MATKQTENFVLNKLKRESNIAIDGLDLSVHLQSLSRAIRSKSKDEIESELIYIIEYNLTIASIHDIDMAKSWANWSSKASSKKYHSG